jgi:hypothetical protein
MAQIWFTLLWVLANFKSQLLEAVFSMDICYSDGQPTAPTYIGLRKRPTTLSLCSLFLHFCKRLFLGLKLNLIRYSDEFDQFVLEERNSCRIGCLY